MTGISPLRGAIIAAGEGSRLRRDGWPMPKPLVPVAGVPLVEWVIRNFVAAGIRSLAVIVNEQERDCVAWVERRFPDLDLRFVVKTTRSSLESFGEVVAGPSPGSMLVSTVDAWCVPADFVRFVERATARPPGATVLAVTPLVADERPLWVDADAQGRITRIGGAPAALVTAGVYLVSESVRRRPIPPALGRLREFLAFLHGAGEPMFAEVIEKVVDVDRAEDVALAAAMVAAERTATGGVE